MNRKKVTTLTVLLALLIILSGSFTSTASAADAAGPDRTVPADSVPTDHVLGEFCIVRRDVSMYESSSEFGSGECSSFPVDLVFCVNGVAYLNDDGSIYDIVYHTYSKEYIWTGRAATLEDRMHEAIYAAPHYMVHVTDECGGGGWLNVEDLEWDISFYLRSLK